MSTVTVTDLVAGTPATSTAVNATLTSFNSATAAGQLGATNVRVEGVDRWVMSSTGNVVEMNTQTAEYLQLAASAAISNATGTPVVIPLNAGASNLQTPASVTIPSGAKCVVHASVRCNSDSYLYAGTLARVIVYLQESTDGGGTWATVTGGRRAVQMRETGRYCSLNSTTTVPGISETFTWAQYTGTPGTTVLWRIAYETENATVTFDDGVISPQVFLA